MNQLYPFYKKIYYWYILLECTLMPVMFLPVNSAIIHLSIFSAFVIGGFTLYHAIRLYKAMPGHLPLFGLFTGIIFVLGGSIFDMTTTIICSPDLSEEGNPLLVALLNHNFPLYFIYLFTLFYQMLKVSINLYLWSAFLKGYPMILNSIPYKNFFITIQWLIGAGKMNFSDFLLSKNIQFEFLVPCLCFIIFSSNFIHWYAGLEWLKIIPYGPDTIILAFWIILFSVLILAWMTHFKLKRIHKNKVLVA